MMGLLLLASWFRVGMEGRPQIIAHRAMGFGGLENSHDALISALQSEVDAIELDVRGTRDGKFVVSHSPFFRSPSGWWRYIRSATLSELRTLKCLTLDEALGVFRKDVSSKRLTLEVKEPGTEDALIRFIKEFNLEERVDIISWNPRTLAAIHRDAPWAPLILSFIAVPSVAGLCSGKEFWKTPVALKQGIVPIATSNIVPLFGCPSIGYIAALKSFGSRVFITCSPGLQSAQTLVQHGVDGIMSKKPDILLKAFSQCDSRETANQKPSK